MLKGEIKNQKFVSIRLYAELNDFLHNQRAHAAFRFFYSGRTTLREVLNGLRIPLSEVDLILVNGQSQDFQYRLQQQDRISIYPVFETIDISPVAKIRKKPLRTTRFILDAHLGKLAKYLRMLGFDSLYKNDFEDAFIIAIAASQNRIILTRDKALLSDKKVSHGYFVRAINTKAQLSEIMNKFDLYSQVSPFSRCINCNQLLKRISADAARPHIKNDTARIFKLFYQCSGCHKIYWKGSHYQRMMQLINDQLTASGKASTNRETDIKYR